VLENITIAVSMMPALTDLCVDGLPTFTVPKTVRRFTFVVVENHLPGSDFYTNLSRVDELQELRLSLSFTDDRLALAAQKSRSVNNSMEVTEGQLPNLRILDVHTNTTSDLVNTFCSQVLRVCPSLEEVKLHGVAIMSKSTVGTATRSLRKLSIQNRFLLFEDKKIENPPEADQWGFLCSLSQPQLSELRLDFDPTFSPTPGDIEIISQSSPQLRNIKLRMNNRRGFNIAPPSKEKNVSYDLEWLYMKSSEAKHKVERDIDTIMCFDCNRATYTHFFDVDLRVFGERQACERTEADGGHQRSRRPLRNALKAHPIHF
jgi:hypothetical protein